MKLRPPVVMADWRCSRVNRGVNVPADGAYFVAQSVKFAAMSAIWAAQSAKVAAQSAKVAAQSAKVAAQSAKVAARIPRMASAKPLRPKQLPSPCESLAELAAPYQKCVDCARGVN